MGEVTSVRREGDFMAAHVRCQMEALQLGESIAVNGACLTASKLLPGGFAVDISAETVACTALRDLKQGQRVNLERAMSASDRFGGHIVTGHIDGAGEVCSIKASAEEWACFCFQAPSALARYLAPKGSICVDGVSLTINQVMGEQFEVQIVPHTMRETLFGSYRSGDLVNLEVDLIARYLERLLQQSTK